MANIDACLLRLRNLGYKARVPGPPLESDELSSRIYEINGPELIVRCPSFTVIFNEKRGIRIEPIVSVEARLFKGPEPRYMIFYGFANQDFFFSMDDDVFIECVLEHVRKAHEVVQSLPPWLRLG